MRMIKIVLSVCILLVLLWGWVLYFLKTRPNLQQILIKLYNCFKKNWRSILWIIIYIILLSLSTNFVINNWEKCLDMEFFSRFNGYNIIWLLWLFLLLMLLVSVDNQWLKIPNPLAKKQKEIDDQKEYIEYRQNISEFSELKKEGTNNNGHQN